MRVVKDMLMRLDKNRVIEIIKKKLEVLRCTDCSKLQNNIPHCHECNTRWSISEDYVKEIANEIERKALKSNE